MDAIFFDLEGTIITLNQQYFIVNKALESEGIHLNIPKIYKLRGFGKYNVSKEFFKALVAFSKFKLNEKYLSNKNLESKLDYFVSKLTDDDIKLAKKLRKKYKKLRYGIPKIKDKLFPETKKALQILSKKYVLCIYTAIKRQSTVNLLHELRIDKLFDVIIGGEIKRKIGSKFIEKICRDMKASRENSYVVGDSEVDIIDGRKAGLKTILVLTGNGSVSLQKKAKPDFVVKKLIEIPKILKM